MSETERGPRGPVANHLLYLRGNIGSKHRNPFAPCVKCPLFLFPEEPWEGGGLSGFWVCVLQRRNQNWASCSHTQFGDLPAQGFISLERKPSGAVIQPVAWEGPAMPGVC